MTTYTIQPHPWWPDTHVEILADGIPRCGTPIGSEQEMIAFLEQSSARHWGEVLKRQEALDPRLVIAAGHAYSIGSSDDNPRGFGGQRWSIKFHDGRLVSTCSLWHMGEVPSEWRERLPDNAVLR